MLIYKLPHALVVGVEDVWAILVDHDTGGRVAFRMAIPTNVRALVPNFSMAIKLLYELSCKNCSGKAGSDDEEFHLFATGGTRGHKDRRSTSI